METLLADKPQRKITSSGSTLHNIEKCEVGIREIQHQKATARKGQYEKIELLKNKLDKKTEQRKEKNPNPITIQKKPDTGETGIVGKPKKGRKLRRDTIKKQRKKLFQTKQPSEQTEDITLRSGYEEHKISFEEIADRLVQGDAIVLEERHRKALARGLNNNFQSKSLIARLNTLLKEKGFELTSIGNTSFNNFPVNIKGAAEYCKLTNKTTGAGRKLIITPQGIEWHE